MIRKMAFGRWRIRLGLANRMRDASREHRAIGVARCSRDTDATLLDLKQPDQLPGSRGGKAAYRPRTLLKVIVRTDFWSNDSLRLIGVGLSPGFQVGQLGRDAVDQDLDILGHGHRSCPHPPRRGSHRQTTITLFLSVSTPFRVPTTVGPSARIIMAVFWSGDNFRNATAPSGRVGQLGLTHGEEVTRLLVFPRRRLHPSPPT